MERFIEMKEKKYGGDYLKKRKYKTDVVFKHLASLRNNNAKFKSQFNSGHQDCETPSNYSV